MVGAFGNNIHGQIPKWMWNTNTKTLKLLGLSNNFFTGFDQLPDVLPYANLRMLCLSMNMLQGPLLIPPPSTVEYDISENLLTGEISSLICNLSSLEYLRNNSFHGNVPGMCKIGSNLRMMDLSSNSCKGNYPVTGELPSEYLSIWSSMKEANTKHSNYLKAQTSLLMINEMLPIVYGYLITITNKGVERYYKAIMDNFAVNDLSTNRFEGEIPNLIGSLQGLHSLNLSNNLLNGAIPITLGNLTELESLDLSQNQLTSYEGNPGLCGKPSPRQCETPPSPPSTSEKEDQSGSSIKVDWRFALARFIGGFIVAVVLSDSLTLRLVKWLIDSLETFGWSLPKRRRDRRRRRV
ncbi:receptor like protein 28-like [Ziziphus jujuba]|uniref:Receptor like protein 28-like n=1 Tax=Ziziphus jujuba TaxID=326968 RepID=A0ABM4ADP8_ZIZJJ|nr:receptor like protein 28-like [Ziziphus jujuba]